MKPSNHMADADTALAEKTQRRRKETGLTQKQAAEACDVSPQQWQKYEHATNRVSVAMLVKICGVFNVPVTYFFSALQETFDWEHELLMAWRQLPAEKRLIATNFVKAMADRPADGGGK